MCSRIPKMVFALLTLLNQSQVIPVYVFHIRDAGRTSAFSIRDSACCTSHLTPTPRNQGRSLGRPAAQNDHLDGRIRTHAVPESSMSAFQKTLVPLVSSSVDSPRMSPSLPVVRSPVNLASPDTISRGRVVRQSDEKRRGTRGHPSLHCRS